MHLDIESLERATLDAVAPPSMEALPDWLLPFDSGTVGRATSAVPLRHQALDPEIIPWIESRYAARGLQAQFRIAEVDGLKEVTKRLRQLGYSAHKPTLTMSSKLADWPLHPMNWEPQLSGNPTASWQVVYMAAEFDVIDGANRVRALSRSTCATYAWIEDAQKPIAAATAAISHGWLSLHGLRTRARAQNLGCASALINCLRNYAKTQGIQNCFLQVEEENAPAIRLYNRLGFETAWRYHYWRKSINSEIC